MVAIDVVVVAVRGTDGMRIGILEVECRVEVAIVIGDPSGALHGWLDVVARVRFKPRIDVRSVTPAFVVQLTVDGDRPLSSRDAYWIAGERRLRRGLRSGERGSGDGNR